MIFVDTGAWYAGYVTNDPHHAQVKPLIDGATVRLVTTDLVLTESLNLFRARKELDRGILLGQNILAHGVAELVFVTPGDIERAFTIFSTYRDKAWSFTDCTSLIVMQRLGIQHALALDHHFHQMPGIAVTP